MRIRVHSCLCFAASLLFADGGAVQFRKEAGPLIVTLFSSPVPLRVGVADLSVLVQNARDAGPVLDAQVALHLSRDGDAGIDLEATRAQAANKLFYAAHLALPAAGQWRVNVQVKSNGATFDLRGDIGVLPGSAPWITNWPYFVPVPIGVLLFVLNQRIKGRRTG